MNHAWMKDVVADLYVYAHQNDLSEIADALAALHGVVEDALPDAEQIAPSRNAGAQTASRPLT